MNVNGISFIKVPWNLRFNRQEIFIGAKKTLAKNSIKRIVSILKSAHETPSPSNLFLRVRGDKDSI